MATPSDFVHLHLHSQYSVNHGFPPVPAIVRRAAELGQSALALTDYGGVFGVREFGEVAAKHGIAPIFGMEAVVRDGEPGAEPAHLTLWARNQEGVLNLFRLSAAEPVDSVGLSHPVVSFEQLGELSGGLIVGSGCGAGRIAEHLREGRTELAITEARRLQGLVGKEYFYVELQADQDPELPREALVEVARAVGAPLLAVQNVQEAEELLSAEEMYQRFADFPEACANTVRLAGQCEALLPVITAEDDLRPRIELGERSETSALRELAHAGLRDLYPTECPPRAHERLEAELDAIERGNGATHFLVLHELMAWCRANGIEVGPGSGSTAGSLVARALGITEIDPVAEGIPLARIAQQGIIRGDVLMVKVPEGQRQRVVSHLTNRYGQDRVATTAGLAEAGVEPAERVLISRESLLNVLPLVRESAVETPVAITSWRYGGDHGLFSLWIQPERTLDAIATWSEQCGQEVAAAARRDYGDIETWRLLGRGDVNGIPILEANGLAEYLQILKPESMAHLQAALALYRGGAITEGLHLEYAFRKNGLITVDAAAHPELRELYATLMPETFGILVYQEQWIELVSHVLGIPLEEANELRRRFMRRIPTLHAEEEDRFFGGCARYGLSRAAAEMLWCDLQMFGDSAMLHAHIVGEARTTFQAAYLKAHHPEYRKLIDGTAW